MDENEIEQITAIWKLVISLDFPPCNANATIAIPSYLPNYGDSLLNS